MSGHAPPTARLLLLDAGDDEEQLVGLAQQRQISGVVPFRPPLGRPSAPSRPERAAFITSPLGKKLFSQRSASIEPFFDTLQAWFGLAHASNAILGALYAWNLLIRFNACRHAPLGVMKPVLALL